MNRNVAQVGDGDTLQNWFNSLPLVTKIFLVSNLIMGASLTFKWLEGASMVLFWPMILKKFQIWRLFTSFIFAGPFSLNFAFHVYILYQNLRKYEENPYNTGAGGNSADVLWMILLSMGCLLLIAYIFDMMILTESLLYVILYVGSRRDPNSQVNMMGFRFKSIYLPWVYIAIRLLMGGGITEPLLGVAVGHLYFYLVEVLPTTRRRQVIFTPSFCNRIVAYLTGFMPVPTTGVHVQAPPERAAPATANNPTEGLRNRGTYNWGQGRTLGTN